jgi:photosynthetic reaction center cytochrome c subunit
VIEVDLGLIPISLRVSPEQGNRVYNLVCPGILNPGWFMAPKRTRPLLLIVLGLLLGIVSSGRGQSSSSTVAHPDTQVPAPQLVSEPAGASRCQFCHRSEVEGYARSAMAHSLRRAGHEPDGTVDTPDAKITMHSSLTGYWQRLQSGGDIATYRIDYVIGSGNHASGYLLDLADHLFQSPVAYYKSRHAYDLAPGYEGLPNPDFTRPVADGCLFCHSGTALHISGTSNQYRSPAFSAEAITCERCHGSAEKHLRDPRAGTIINPAKLEPAARDSVCEQCHLLGVGRVLNPGEKFGDFRPGQRLEDIFTTYCNALPPGTEAGKFKVISHVEQLARSTCARKSNAQLWCGTCHDPHNTPLEPVQFYRSKCLSCHTGKFSGSHPGRNSNCISCHMPRRDAKDGGHTAFTDHRIQRHPEPQPDLPGDLDITAWREPATDLQKRNLGIAYVNVGAERRSPPFLIRGYGMLTEVQNQFSTDHEVFTAMGTALLLAKQSSEAELAFERALQLNPDSVTGETNAASAYLQAGDLGRAIAHLERAVAIDPLHLPADAPLIDLYKRQGNLAKAAELSGKVSAAMERQSLPGKTAEKSPSSSPQMAEVAFKNIQVLKGVSSDQLVPAMRFITASLGVECGYCHVEGHFEKDDKKAKQIARDMMRMMLAIDKDSFEGNREVTCYSCHRGSPKPEAIPLVGNEVQPKPEMARAATSKAENLPANLPTADQLIDNYIHALGGAAAIEKITSREEKGTTLQGGNSISVEVFDQDPNQQVVVRHMPAGDSITVFNGHEGWSVMPGRPVGDMRAADLDTAQMDADLHFPLHIKNIFAELRVEYPETIGDREAYVVLGIREGQPPVKFYFDEQSGLLVRLVRYAESPLGRDPTQIDYGDYRDADGVETPFRWTVAQLDGSSTIQLEQVKQNVPIGDAKFAKPPAPEASPKPPAP